MLLCVSFQAPKLGWGWGPLMNTCPKEKPPRSQATAQCPQPQPIAPRYLSWAFIVGVFGPIPSLLGPRSTFFCGPTAAPYL